MNNIKDLSMVNTMGANNNLTNLYAYRTINNRTQFIISEVYINVYRH